MNLLSKKTFGIFVLLTLFFFAATPEAARAVTETTIGGQLSATLQPADPGAGETVAISLTSFATNLTASTITWTVNGKQLKKGIGETDAKITVGAAGSRTTVSISVSSPAGDTTQKTLTFLPQELSIAWEAQSYTPPLYRGKALPGPGGIVRVVALPEFKNENGVTINPRDLVYRWQQSFEDIPGGSGKGVQTANIKTNVLGTTKISVDVRTTDGALRAKKTIEIETVQPRILFYEDRPLLGTQYNATIGSTLILSKSETTVRAEPFFFSNPIEKVLFSWMVNESAGTPDRINPQVITLRHEEGVRGSAQVQTNVSAPGFLFQDGKGTFITQF